MTHCKKTEAGECFKILAYLSSKLKKKDKACEYYEKAISFNANDYESMIEYAALMETMDPTNALNCIYFHRNLNSCYSVYTKYYNHGRD